MGRRQRGEVEADGRRRRGEQLSSMHGAGRQRPAPAVFSPQERQAMNAITNPKDRPVKISCRNVWKVYGERPETFFPERNGKVPDPAATLKAARDSRHIAAAADVSFDVHAGE